MRLIKIAVLTAAGTLAVFWGAIYPRSWRYQQQVNGQLAEAEITSVREELDHSPRIRGVELAPIEAYNGGLVIHGTVASDAELLDLYQRVNRLHPRTPVYWEVRVSGREK